MCDARCDSFQRLRWSDLRLTGVPLLSFVKTQCPVHIAFFVAYRLGVILYLFSCFVVDLVSELRPGGPNAETPGLYFTLLTRWGYIALLGYLACALWNLVVYLAKKGKADWTTGKDDDDVPWYFFHRGQWLLFNMSTAVSLAITIIYWAALFTPGIGNLFFVINFRLVNGVVSLIEIFFTTTVVRILHFVYPLALAIIYAGFTGVYFAAMGTNSDGDPYIYPLLDYGSNPAVASGVVVGAVIGVAGFHIVIVWGIYQLKLWAFRKWCPSCFPREEDDGDNRADVGDHELNENPNA